MYRFTFVMVETEKAEIAVGAKRVVGTEEAVIRCRIFCQTELWMGIMDGIGRKYWKKVVSVTGDGKWRWRRDGNY